MPEALESELGSDSDRFNQLADELLGQSSQYFSVHLITEEQRVLSRQADFGEQGPQTELARKVTEQLSDFSAVIMRLAKSAAGLNSTPQGTCISFRSRCDDDDYYFFATHLKVDLYCVLVTGAEVNPSRARFFLSRLNKRLSSFEGNDLK